MAGPVTTEIDRVRVPVRGTGERVPSIFDPRRFAHLSEREILGRIGGLLATALVRSGRLLRRPGIAASVSSPVAAKRVEPWDLVSDPIERQLVRFLHHAGPTAPRDLATAVGISRRTTVRKFIRLRTSGVCEVSGRTRGALYRVRTAHDKN